ncbi:MAG TPA: DUF1573 domain-containing protein [Bacteroidales bacterium]|nr:DUF1573 domain-containing protein [Bacteroidales bacterium]
MKKTVLFFLVMIQMSVYTSMAQKSINEEYPTAMGHIQISTPQIAFNTIKNTDVLTDTLKIINVGEKEISMSFSELPAHITCKLIPERLSPKQKGIIVLTWDALKSNYFGSVYERINLSTNDSVQLIKPLDITAYIVEDFSNLTPEQLQNAAKIKFENTTYNFGSIKEGEKIETDFKFTNVGINDLFIRKVKASCGCTATHIDKIQLKKEECSSIHATVDTRGRAGQLNKTITVVCNDPDQSTIILSIIGKVDKISETPQKKSRK